jgi:D-glycero-D-manno-heptose 1,7-bisphosphate phosphatase
MRAAIFLERDGILNKEGSEGNYPIAPMMENQFEPNLEAVEPLNQLKAAGFLLIVTTNQPLLSSGRLGRQQMDRMHARLRQVFPLDDIFVCPHDASDFCPCRKPRPGLFTEAAFKHHIDLDKSFVVSNKWQDAEAARNIGCTSLLIQSPWIGQGHHDVVLPHLQSITERVLRKPVSRMLVNV